eukprot:CAMPEP_0202460356 /NCGR_PEP_ID=MMETSP1360-20130828/43384_1 /ASSEMBLY_ACC=CAM_ASM_000848 /TAXON_ID=515479 /ORGANISM="Licmophora paradoxa, Strain CCMP2313" /LENGTH=169 /DNA_ID=CAMNT_0049081965 /DNA_START=350 /DNA_END=859 /DNA_ORIENTATION=+
MVTEFGWQVLERSDTAQGITVIDLKGIRMTDFVGECVDFVRRASAFTGAHYPERAGCVFVIHVPTWFQLIWKAVRPMIDPITLQKIKILRDPQEIKEALLERIPLENIPREYGGTCPMGLGESPEETLLWELMNHNNAKANAAGGGTAPPCSSQSTFCQHCHFVPARAY